MYFLPASKVRSTGPIGQTVLSAVAQTLIEYVAGGDLDVVGDLAELEAGEGVDLAVVDEDVDGGGVGRAVQDADLRVVGCGDREGGGEGQGAGGDEAGKTGDAHGCSLQEWVGCRPLGWPLGRCRPAPSSRLPVRRIGAGVGLARESNGRPVGAGRDGSGERRIAPAAEPGVVGGRS